MDTDVVEQEVPPTIPSLGDASTQATAVQPTPLRAITLYQPWATLLVQGYKRIETRSWDTKIRGPVLVHASKAWSRKLAAVCREHQHFKALRELGHVREGMFAMDTLRPLTLGAILGVVEIVDTAGTVDLVEQGKVDEPEQAFGDYSPDRFGWTCVNPLAFKTPIATPGAQQFWWPSGEVQLKVAAAIKAQTKLVSVSANVLTSLLSDGSRLIQPREGFKPEIQTRR